MSDDFEYAYGKWGWEAKDFGEVTFSKGDQMRVVERNGEWWRGIFADGRNGWFPGARVRELTDATAIAELKAAIARYEKVHGPIDVSEDDENDYGDVEVALPPADAQPAPVALNDSKKAKKDKSLKKSKSGKKDKNKSKAASTPVKQESQEPLSPRGEPLGDEPIYVRAKWAWKAKAPTELTMEKGALLRITKKHGEWWKGKLADGQHGWFPSARVVDVSNDASTAAEIEALEAALGAPGATATPNGSARKTSRSGSVEPTLSPNAAQSKNHSLRAMPADAGEPVYYYAKWGWEPRADGELHMKKGEELRVSARTDEWWKGRTTSGVSGWFPKQRVRPITDPAQLKQVEAAFRKLAKKRAQQKASDGSDVGASPVVPEEPDGDDDEAQDSAPPPVPQEPTDDDGASVPPVPDSVQRPPTPPVEPGEFSEVPPPTPPVVNTDARPVPPREPDEEAPPPIPPLADADDDSEEVVVAKQMKASSGGLDALLDDLEGLEQASRGKDRNNNNNNTTTTNNNSSATSISNNNNSATTASGNDTTTGNDKLDMSALDDLLDDLNPSATSTHFGVGDDAVKRKADEIEAAAAAAAKAQEAAKAAELAAQKAAEEKKAHDEAVAAEKLAREQKSKAEAEAAARAAQEAAEQRAAAERDAAEKARIAEAAAKAAAEEERLREQAEREASEEAARAADAARAAELEQQRAEQAAKAAADERAQLAREKAEAAERAARIEAETRARVEAETRARIEAEVRATAEREAAEREAAERQRQATLRRQKAEADKRRASEAALAAERAREAAAAATQKAEQERLALARERETAAAERAAMEREIEARVERETRERVEREIRARVEQETRERVEREMRERAERDARATPPPPASNASANTAAAPVTRSAAVATTQTGNSGGEGAADLDALLGDLDTATGTMAADLDELDNLDFGDDVANTDASRISDTRKFETSAAAASAAAMSGRSNGNSTPAAPPAALSSGGQQTFTAQGGRRVTLSALEADVYKLLQQLHRAPGSFADLIERKRLPFFEGKAMILTHPTSGRRVRFITSEGIAAAQDCVRALRALSNELPLPELTLSQGMTVAAKQGLPANSSFGTIRQFGRFEGRVVETCCFDQDTAEDIVLQLLIDDGDAQRTKRRMLIDREFNNVGIAADKEKCLVNFATRFHDK